MKSTFDEMQYDPGFRDFMSSMVDTANYQMALEGDVWAVQLVMACAFKAGLAAAQPDTVTLPTDVIREVAEGLKELSLPPYGDSDLRSLGTWAAARATSLLALLESHLPKESKS